MNNSISNLNESLDDGAFAQTVKREKAPDFSLAIINIVFLLLFFFIIAGSVVQRAEMETQAPATETLPLERLPRPLLVVTLESELVLDGVPISLPELKEKIKDGLLSGKNSKKSLNILAERDLPAVAVIEIVDELRTSGAAIKLVTIRVSKE